MNQHRLGILLCLVFSISILAPSELKAAQSPVYTIHASSYPDKAEADRVVSSFQARGYESFARLDGKWHQVYLGRFKSRDEAETQLSLLQSRDFLSPRISYQVMVINTSGTVTPAPAEVPPELGFFSLHLSSYRKENDAAQDVSSFQVRGLTAFTRYETVSGQGMWYRVYVGRFSSRVQAEAQARQLIQQGLLSVHSNYRVVFLSRSETKPASSSLQAEGRGAKEVSGFRETIEGSYVGSYKDKYEADRQAEGLTLKGWPAFVSEGETGGAKWYRVYLSPTGEKLGGLKGFEIISDLSRTETGYKRQACCLSMSRYEATIALLRKMNSAIPTLGSMSALRVVGQDSPGGPAGGILLWGPRAYDRNGLGWAIDQQRPTSGAGPLGVSVSAADVELSTWTGKKALIVLSDFKKDRDLGGPVEHTSTLKRKHGSDLCVYSIYICADEAGIRLARDLALAGGCGTFYDGCLLLSDQLYFDAMIRRIFYGGRIDCPDEDGDGVCNDRDECPGTPLGAPVDERGCWIVAFTNYFDFNKDVVKKKYLANIKHTADVLKINPRTNLVIAGHTDNIGSATYNLDLGRRRAEAVRQLLIKNGVSPESLQVKSYGFSKPIDSNSTEAGRARNRRVEIEGWQRTPYR